jgi:steroid delta-isomerase-like uncharacterized protein
LFISEEKGEHTMGKEPNHVPLASTIEEWVTLLRTRQVSRRQFITQLTEAGASATALATLLAAVHYRNQAPAPSQRSSTSVTEHQNLQLHEAHIAQQQHPQAPPSSDPDQLHPHIERRVSALMDDYHQDAVVEDMLVGTLIGHEAIAHRKRAEFTSMTGTGIHISQRFAYGDQVIAEWMVSGTHSGDFWGFPATGQSFSIRGLTVVTRRDGRIVKESLYYDVADVRRQLMRA